MRCRQSSRFHRPVSVSSYLSVVAAFCSAVVLGLCGRRRSRIAGLPAAAAADLPLPAWPAS